MDTSELKSKSLNAAFWNIAGTIIKQGISFIISIFLARLLSPSDYGLVAMATVFITFTQGFSDLGLSSALIKTKEPTEIQYSSVFYFNVFVASMLALTLYVCAGPIANFYNNSEVEPIVKFVSYSFLVNALTTVHWAIFYKNLQIKFIRWSTILNALVSGPIGIILAYNNFGVWSIVYSSFAGNLSSVIFIWSFSRWRPQLIFKFSEIRALLSFGIKVFFINYIQAVYEKLDILIIGKIFTPADLGQYSRASSFNQLVTRYSAQGLSGVFFPVISKLQDNYDAIRGVFEKTIQTICFLTFMLTGFLYINSEPLIILFFSNKWYPAVDYFKILALSSYVFPMTIIFNGVLLGTGNPGKQLKLEIIKKSLGVIGIVIGFLFGINGYLWALVATGTIGLMFSLYFIKQTISITILKNLINIYVYVVPLLVAAIPVTIANTYLFDDLMMKLIVGSLFYFLVYVSMSHLMQLSGYKSARKLFYDLVILKYSRFKRPTTNPK